MEKLYASGKAKSIGVSNWSIGRLKQMLAYATVKPAINQIEIHPFFQQTPLIEFCFANDILPVAYSPLGSQGDGTTLMKSPELNALAEKKGVSLAQVLISWGIKRGYAVLPKSATKTRVQSNIQPVELNDEDVEEINKISVGKEKRFVSPGQFGYDVFAEV